MMYSSQILPKLKLNSHVMNDIRDAISAGREVAAHEKTINYKGWKGFGYIIIDPYSGSGAYLIDGGANGGWTALYDALGILLQFFSYVADYSSKILQIAQYADEFKGAISVLDDILGKYFVVARFTQTIGGILLADCSDAITAVIITIVINLGVIALIALAGLIFGPVMSFIVSTLTDMIFTHLNNKAIEVSCRRKP